MKQQINEWAREEVKKMMLCEAIQLQVKHNGVVIQKFTQIGAAYAKDGSAYMHQLMLQVIYGTFRHQPGWARDLEEKYMMANNIVYKDNEPDLEGNKGFIEFLVTEQYSETKHGITDHAKKAHGRFVRLREDPKPKKEKNDVDDLEEHLPSEITAFAASMPFALNALKMS